MRESGAAIRRMGEEQIHGKMEEGTLMFITEQNSDGLLELFKDVWSVLESKIIPIIPHKS
jgi:hypothetical protein